MRYAYPKTSSVAQLLNATTTKLQYQYNAMTQVAVNTATSSFTDITSVVYDVKGQYVYLNGSQIIKDLPYLTLFALVTQQQYAY